MNQPVRTLLASNSRFFLEGIRKILGNEKGIKIVAEALNREEMEKHLISLKPRLLLLDNRTLSLDIHELLNLTGKNGLDVRVIVLGKNIEEEPVLPNILYIGRETSSSELIKAIKETHDKNTQNNRKNEIPEALPILYVPDIVELTESAYGRSNERKKQIGRENRSSVEASTPIREESEEITQPRTEAGSTKKHLQEQREMPGREITLHEKRYEENWKLLSLPYRQLSHPATWKRRILSSFSREVNRVVVLLLLISGFTYIGSNYFDGRAELARFIRELISPLTTSKIKSDIETNLGKLWEQGYEDIKLSVIKGKAVLRSKASAVGDSAQTQLIQKVEDGKANHLNGRFTLKTLMDQILFPPTDSSVKSNIETELWKKGYRDIKVTVTDGKAVVSGKVTTQEDRQAIQNIAENVPGIKQVENGIVVEEIISDQKIASGIRKELDDKGYKNIEVTVINRKAILSGTLSNQEESKVIKDIAINIEGVETLEDNLKIQPKKEKRRIVKRVTTTKKDRHLAYQDSITFTDEAPTQTKSEWKIRK
jgi:osmotically-inducible protein OsmY/DNA-binding NarL/FixJ family response regulator